MPEEATTPEGFAQEVQAEGIEQAMQIFIGKDEEPVPLPEELGGKKRGRPKRPFSVDRAPAETTTPKRSVQEASKVRTLKRQLERAHAELETRRKAVRNLDGVIQQQAAEIQQVVAQLKRQEGTVQAARDASKGRITVLTNERDAARQETEQARAALKERTRNAVKLIEAIVFMYQQAKE